MSDCPYQTAYATTIEMLGILYREKLYFFERGAVEVVTSETRERYWLIVVDCATTKSARCFPLHDPIADWERLIGLEAPDVLKVAR